MTTRSQFPDEQDDDGGFERQPDAFRDWIRADGSTPYDATSDRYHLYVSLACPWAHRTLILRRLRGLEDVIGATVVDPVRTEKEGWAFRDGPGHSRDPVNHFAYLREAYEASQPGYRGRWTVPVLWDRTTRRIVNNSEDDICRMLHDAFPARSGAPDLFPVHLAAEQAALSERIYAQINNGVYRAGFATEQRAYEEAVRGVFRLLDELEARLESRRFLLGANFVETDWRLFCTLVRFDAVYHGHFKCNLRRVVDYPNLAAYLRDLYQTPGLAETVSFDHIKRHYYVTHTAINPTQIVPLGPMLDLAAPHDRARLGW